MFSLIYQLKITLKYMKPPVWRRIQVDSTITFKILHQLIQAAFDWEDYHLHEFRLKSREGSARQPSLFALNEVLITNTEIPNDFGLGEPSFEEKHGVLEDYFKKEKDKGLYVYDFGDDWQHEILLEKIVPAEEGVTYPRCIKAMREAPPEDSGGLMAEPEEVDNPPDLAKEINNKFRKFQGKPQEKAPAQKNWIRLFELVDDFKKLKPWQWLWSNQVIMVQVPDLDEFAYASVMGRDGSEFGLAAYIGNDGLRSFKEALNWEGEEPFDFMARQRSIVLSLSDRNELEQEDYRLIKNLGLRFRGKKQWPMFRSMKPGYHPWMLEDEEVQMFVVILEQVMEATRQAQGNSALIPEADQEKWYARVPVASTQGRIWREQWLKPVLKKEQSLSVPLFVSELKLKQLRKQFRNLNKTIEFGTFYAPNPVQENEGERPYYPFVITAVERKQGMVIFNEIIGPEGFSENLQHAFVKMIEHLEKVPREVWLDSVETAEILKPLFNGLSIQSLKVDKLQMMNEVKEYMYSMGLR